ncbi:phage integrase Arm DNA-binding domain-containing protein [Thalassolituus sp. ST750PaO-4]|uniref:phage integrase Arm DNA-binding domain-containing protein n=1 Tax=Thalassolituus sp. ST750PaO-4 TaxID=2742965 RepID=UPI001CE368A4|nr:phage integrase Arm DNA-binding domain-containing protein [Thalassolituus sp. ST750PaO-4]
MARQRTKANSDLPENLYRYGRDNQYFRYRHPQTGKMHGMGSDKIKAIAAAKKLNHILMKPSDLVRAVLDSSHESFANCIRRYQEERQPLESLKPATVKLENYRLNALSKDLGHYLADDLTVKACAEWLDGFKGNAYTKHRGTLIKVCTFAVSKGLMRVNVGLNTMTAPRLTEKKRRRPLSKEWYDLIYQGAPEWLQVAMALALVTLQRRGDLVLARFNDIEGDRLKIIQAKTEQHGHRAFLKIQIGESLAGIIERSQQIKPLNCPFIVHRLPARRIPFDGQEHHGQVQGDYLGKTFQKVRDQIPVFKEMEPEERPTFHEIRALGGALYLRQGFSKEYVNLLMGHTTQKMTDDYTDRHQQWTECAAELVF